MPLRIVPPEPLVDDKRYKEIIEAFNSIQNAEPGSSFFWDLGKNEKAPLVKKELQFVADKEGVALQVTRMRGKASFQLKITGTRKAATASASGVRSAILKALKKGALGKAQIVEKAGDIPNFNNHIRKLLDEGKIIKEGDRRNTLYRLA